MNKRILQQFGARVREERTQRDVSQERLGELAKTQPMKGEYVAFASNS